MIRRAVPSDGDTVRKIVFDTMREYGVEADPEGIDRDVMTFGQAAAGAMAFVAEVDKCVVGSVIVTPRGNGRATLSKFFLSDAHRGRGIGRMLLETAVNAARDVGLSGLDLDTKSVFRGDSSVRDDGLEVGTADRPR
ncbi:MAG TPA: GNAT family N-acetyltransferase [Candidatus Eremiobacteraceae bacterium]|nr:GNAT family N-acetyltransferase [Candidatus Eremiobacteraceae bacterium]